MPGPIGALVPSRGPDWWSSERISVDYAVGKLLQFVIFTMRLLWAAIAIAAQGAWPRDPAGG